jgi:acetyl coenzyme A synthetase (ADP forming)-like protein
MEESNFWKKEEEADFALKDGSIIHLREAREEDKEKIKEFYKSLSEESIYLRFQSAAVDLDGYVDRISKDKTAYCLVAEREGRVAAHACFSLLRDGKAEPSIAVLDKYQGKGLGTIMLAQLSLEASKRGVTIFEVYMLPENYRMINLIKRLGLKYETKIEPGQIVVAFSTSIDNISLENFEKRDKISSYNAVKSILYPKSVAVIGASRQRSTIGGELFHNILEGCFNGPVYPVNKNAEFVQSVKAYRSLLECPGDVELAVIAVPAENVVDVARECSLKGVKALVVISAGFAETGPEGLELQKKLVQVCRDAGIRLVGPNCMGVVNTDRDISLNAQFSPFTPKEGSIGFLSQSGALGIAVIEHANRLGLGMSSFVSVGNKADISGNDLVQFWEDDPRTKVIILYLESFGNARKFAVIARRVSRKKPIVVVKAGRSSAGFRATQSHTGALLSSSDTAVDALFRQCGVIRTDTLEEMFDVSSFLLTQPLPESGSVAIITNAGGAGILAADACESHGLSVPEFSQETQNALKGILPRGAGVRNPVDMVASASKKHYTDAIRIVSKDRCIDSMIVIFIPPVHLSSEEVAGAILDGVRSMERRIPVLVCMMAGRGIPEVLSDGEITLPSFPFPEEAAKTLAKVARYSSWLKKPSGRSVYPHDVSKAEVLSTVSRALSHGGGWLRARDVIHILESYGIETVPTYFARNADEAVSAFRLVRNKVAVKGSALNIVHKAREGLVMLNLDGEEKVRDAAEKIFERMGKLNAVNPEVLIQPMVEKGFEMLVGSTYDQIFGSVVACGAGGPFVEMLKDISVCVVPVTDVDVDEIVSSLKVYKILLERGYDINALKEVVYRLSALVQDIPELVEVDLNPLFVFESGRGAAVADARMRVERIAPPLPIWSKKR